MSNTTWISTTPEKQWQDKSAEIASAEKADLSLTGSKHQTWEGFGGCFNELGWIALSALDSADRDKIISELFDQKDGCRFNICRLPIGASDYGAEWYSHNEHDGDFAMERFSIERDKGYLIPYIRESMKLAPEMRLFASPWSPPTWLKFPKVYNYGTLIWKPEYLKAYALYFARFVQAYGEEGIRIDQVHVQNEPVADQKFPSCLWTGQQMTDFIRDHLGPTFEKEGIDAEIWFGTLNTGDYDNYPHVVLSDPAAAKYTSGVGFQWYGKEAVQRTSMSFPGVRMMQTENECGNGANSWEHARYVYSLLWHYITNGVNAYVYWNMVLEPTGRSTWGWTQNSMVTVDPESRTYTLTPEFYVMKHFSRFIDPGAVRLGLTGPWAGNSVAFTNPDGSTVLVVANPWADAKDFAFSSENGSVAGRLEGYSINTFVL